MNILILINNAPNYIKFLKKIGNKFKENGDNVIYASESHLPEFKYDTLLNEEKVYYFTEYKKVKCYEKTNYYQDQVSLRSIYYSCFDRNYHHKIYNKHDKEMDLIICNLLKYFEEIVVENNIDIILYENVSNSFAHSAYLVSKKLNKKYYGLITSRIPNRFEIWEDEYGNIDKREDKFNKLNIDTILNSEKLKICRYIDDIVNKNAKPDYMKNNPTNLKVNYIKYYIKKTNIIKKYLDYYKKYSNESQNAYQSGMPIRASYKSVLRSLKRKCKIKLLKRIYDDFDSAKDKYCLLPLHYQPESSTSVNAIYYDNQYEFIKNVAFSLPIGMKLYVKDHPNGIGFMDMNFYKNIKRIPNVVYINPLEDTMKLIKNCEMVITLTSTVGYEALLAQKPVITIGKVFYNYHPYCYIAKSYKEIYKIVIEIQNKNNWDFDIENIKFLKIYFNDTFEGKLFNQYADENKIYEAIYSRLNSI